MRYIYILFALIFASVAPAKAEVSVGIYVPGISIGINVPAYPAFVPVPGYPVYYAPNANENYFFYDGLFWVFAADNWYVSSWYNGPWQLVLPQDVPLFILRIPVSYYIYPPAYFRGWYPNRPPHWGERWGREWEESRRGWDRWDHHMSPRRAPLPDYQRQYFGDRYPRAEQQQHTIRSQRYNYIPREAITRRNYQEQQRNHEQQRQQQPNPAPQYQQLQNQAPQRQQLQGQQGAPREKGHKQNDDDRGQENSRGGNREFH